MGIIKNLWIYLRMAAEALALAFILEILNRRSLCLACRFAAGRTVPFLCNALIIFATLSVSVLFLGKRYFFAALLLIVWLLFGIVNAIVLRYRMTPFSAEDFAMVPSLFRIAKNYLTPVTLVLIIVALAAILVLVVFLWLKLPRAARIGRYPGVISRTVICIVAMIVIQEACVQSGYLSREFANLADAYEKYGFAYCFTTSVLDVGIGKPRGYSQEEVHAIAENIRLGMEQTQVEDYTGLRPNIIMIQLESFFDPTYIKGFRYSTDPIPFFRELKENSVSGFLEVPVVGAGTSNTEFEVLTGMSTDYFGAGEYPYNTVLKERTVEALPHILQNYGYRSTAIHNNTGTFYNRDLVFAQMGFDTFIPQEYMYDLERTPTNWAKDAVLTDIIMDTLAGTDQPDFIYTITVQSHGRYPQERLLSEAQTQVRVTPVGGEVPLGSLEYYVNELWDVDRMIEALVGELTEYPEPVVLVMYGDHLPALGFGREDLTQSSLYKTEYVLWNNFGLEGESKDEVTEDLGTDVLALFGMTDGIMPRFHLAYAAEEMTEYFGGYRAAKSKYREDLEILEYDMLYGDGYIFAEFPDLPQIVQIRELDDTGLGGKLEGKAGYRASNLKFEYKPIRITGIDSERFEQEKQDTQDPHGRDESGKDDSGQQGIARDSTDTEGETELAGLVVHGENFNEYSRIMIDNKPKNTEYIDSETLRLSADEPAQYGQISVGQFDENLRQLGKCVNSVYYPQLGRGAR